MTVREIVSHLGIGNGSVNNFKKRAIIKLEEKLSLN